MSLLFLLLGPPPAPAWGWAQNQLQREHTGTRPNEHSLKYCYDDKMKTRQLKSQQIGLE